MGLKPTVISTLDAMLSCLPPERNHHTVFASNATLTFRRNGISDRTIRRHVGILQDAGLLVRRDSPNKKRYTRRNTSENKALRFGFDLAPLFQRLQKIAALAADATREREQIDYVRTKIRAQANDILRLNPTHPEAIQALRLLRRKLVLTEYHKLLNHLVSDTSGSALAAEHELLEPSSVSANDSQNVRHHHKSNKELIEKEETTDTDKISDETQEPALSIGEILSACPQASEFLTNPINDMQDIVTHARCLAPMMGIDERTYQLAQDRLGRAGAAITVWGMMQLYHRIHSVGAYFRSITSGKKCSGFSPERFIRRLACTTEACV